MYLSDKLLETSGHMDNYDTLGEKSTQFLWKESLVYKLIGVL